MKAKYTHTLAALLLLTLTLAGCRSTRNAERPSASAKKPQNEQLIPLAKYSKETPFMSAKTVITLNYNGHAMTVKGRLRMRHNEVVQMSLTALGLVEIAMAEFTPKGAYLIDRINKRYVYFDYSSGWMNLAGVNFSAVQGLFWNRLFMPGEKEAWRHTADFSISDAGSQHLVVPDRQRLLQCEFYTDADYRQVEQTNLSLKQYAATWRYDHFETIDGYTYPITHDVSVSSQAHNIGAHIELNTVSTIDTGWQSTTDLSRYKRVEFEELMSILDVIR